MKVSCVYSLESPHQGDSNEYTQYTVFNIKMKITLNFPNLQPRDYFLGTQKRVRISRGKRAISVRATEVLLYYQRNVQSQLAKPLLRIVSQNKKVLFDSNI